MIAKLFKVECITNLHVGNGDVNYNIIDNEVEKDPVTNCPTMNASGIKGAIREFFVNRQVSEERNYRTFWWNNSFKDNSGSDQISSGRPLNDASSCVGR